MLISRSRAGQLWDLTLIQMSNWRWSWRQQLVLGLLVPIASLSILAAVTSGTDVNLRRQLLVGGILTSVVIQNQGLVAMNFAFMKAYEADAFFETLGLPSWMLPIATVTCFTVMSIPSVTCALLLGPYIVGVSVSWGLAAVPILLLTGVCVGFLGAAIGKLTRNPPESSTISQVVNFFLIGAGAVIIQPDRVPRWSHWLGSVNPVQYAADALRGLILEQRSAAIVRDVLILTALTVVIAAATTAVPWRER